MLPRLLLPAHAHLHDAMPSGVLLPQVPITCPPCVLGKQVPMNGPLAQFVHAWMCEDASIQAMRML